MYNHEQIILGQDDFQNISSLVKNAQPDIADPLEAELDRATIVANGDIPADAVSMNSKVIFKDMDTDKEATAILVYPQDVNIDENKISILSPIGSALIGLRVGQLIQWPMPNGKSKRILVMSVSKEAA